MKKLFTILLLCAVGSAAYAQWEGAAAQYHLKYLSEKQQSQVERLSQETDRKVALSTMKIGKYTFELYNQTDAKENGFFGKITVHKYFYRPKNGPAVFQEAVAIDEPTGEFRFISNPASRLVGPLRWMYADYTISEIEVAVYPSSKIEFFKNRWQQHYGYDCVHKYVELKTWPVSTVDVLAAPMRAFYVPSKHQTVEIKALVTSQQTGAEYPRACRYNAPGVLYRKFINGTDSFINKWKK